MPLIRVPVPWYEQPQGVVDLAPEWAGRIAALTIGGVGYVDGGAGVLVPTLGSPTFALGTAGAGPTFSGGAQRFATPNALVPFAGSDPFSLEILCAITAAPSLAGFLSIGTAIELGQQRGLLAFSGANNRRIYFWGGDRDLASDQDWRVDGSLQHVFVTSGGSGTTMRFYRDGEVFFSGTTPALGTSQAAPFHLGRAGWDVTPTGTIFKGAIYRGELSPSEVRRMSERPWSVARDREIFFIAPDAAPPTLSLATAIDITATSARPRVTLTF